MSNCRQPNGATTLPMHFTERRDTRAMKCLTAALEQCHSMGYRRGLSVKFYGKQLRQESNSHKG